MIRVCPKTGKVYSDGVWVGHVFGAHNRWITAVARGENCLLNPNPVDLSKPRRHLTKEAALNTLLNAYGIVP